MSRILVINQHGCNRGDEAACLGMIYGLKYFIPDAEFIVLTVNPLWLEGIENNIVQLRNLVFPSSGKYRISVRAMRLFFSLYTGLAAHGDVADVLNAFRKSDLIISAPGGPYIGDLYPLTEMEVLFHLLLGILSSKPTMIYGPSMGPFENKKRNSLRKYIFRKMALITVRESVSSEYLNTLDNKISIYTTADSALQCPIDLNRGGFLFEQYGLDEGKKHIGFVPLDLERFVSERERTRYIKLIVQSLRLIADRFEANIVLFPQGYGVWRDRPFFEFIVSVSGLENRAFIVSEECGSLDQQALMGMMDGFISFRYHPSIFALRQSVPCVAVAYEHKITGFMRAVNMEEFCLDLNNITAVGLADKLEQACHERESIAQRTKPEICRLEKRAWMNSFLASLILRHQSMVYGTGFADFVEQQIAEWDRTAIPVLAHNCLDVNRA